MNPRDPRHGTMAGNHKHYRDGETPCEPCRRANAERMTARRQRLAEVDEPSFERHFGLLEADDILDESRGRWAPRPGSGGVQVWVPNPPTPEDLRAAQLYGPVVCPCGARQVQGCKSPTGSTTDQHASRVIPRSCLCGESMPSKAIRCKACRDAASVQKENAA